MVHTLYVNLVCSIIFHGTWFETIGRSFYLINRMNILFLFIHGWRRGTRVLTYILWNLSFYKQIGELKKGLNPISIMDLAFGSQYLSTALKTGIVTGVIALAVSISFPSQLWAYFYLSTQVHLFLYMFLFCSFDVNEQMHAYTTTSTTCTTSWFIYLFTGLGY